MKLYTEEQVRKAIVLARLIQEKGSVEDSFDVESISGLTEICTYGWSERHSSKEIINSLTPIELPTDEEIDNEFAPANEIIDEVTYMFIEGAKWMRDKIQGGNNE